MVQNQHLETDLGEKPNLTSDWWFWILKFVLRNKKLKMNKNLQYNKNLDLNPTHVFVVASSVISFWSAFPSFATWTSVFSNSPKCGLECCYCICFIWSSVGKIYNQDIVLFIKFQYV